MNVRVVELTHTAQEVTVSSLKLNPYLHFDGEAHQAIAFYAEALGGQVPALMTQDQAPGVGPEHKHRVMHSEIRIGDALLMVGDVMPGESTPKVSNIHVCLHFTDVAEMQQRYDALAAGGKADHPIHDTFWGAKFGTLTDRFGVRWMFNCETKK